MSVISKASLVLIPSGYGEDILYSEVPNTTAGDFTFTRASTGTRVNADGYIEEVPWNIVQYSEELDDSYWTDDNTLTITENDSTSPIGNTTANKLVVNSGSSNAYVYRFEPTIGEKTLSVYGKKGAKNWLMLACLGAAKRVFFDLDNGVIGTNVGSLGASISDEGNGWYRCTITFTYTSGNSAVYFYVTDNDNTFTVTGNNSDELYLWGAMVNKGNTPKTYIKTTDRLDIPRLDYSGGASCPTLNLEPQRTNLVTYSEDYSQWTKSAANTLVSGQTSPSNTNTAYAFQHNGTTAEYYITKSSVALPSANVTVSAYLKKGTKNWVIFRVGNICLQYFDIENEVLGNNVFGSPISYNFVDAGNDWVRLDMTVLGNGASNNFTIYSAESGSNATTTGTSGDLLLYVWGAMAETGSFPTSYIPTSGTSVTRTDESFVADGLSTIIGQIEGCIFIDFVYYEGNRFEIFDAANTANGFLIYRSGTGYNLQVITSGGGWAITNFITGLTIGTRYKLAINYKLNDYKVYVNGSQAATSTSIGVPTTNKIMSSQSNGGLKFTNNINSFAMFDAKLTDAELTTLTTI